MTKPRAHRWEFKARFRRQAFGWKSQPAVQRVKQAVGEIKSVARKEPVLAAEGAVVFLERLSPALEHVDGSSGAIGTAVNNAIAELVPIIAGAPADAGTRAAWLVLAIAALAMSIAIASWASVRTGSVAARLAYVSLAPYLYLFLLGLLLQRGFA